MKKSLKLLFLIFLNIIIIGLFLPTQYHIEKSIKINAKPSDIHYWVNDLAHWKTWSPWEIIDPSIKMKLGNKTKGVGANQSWFGKSGKGELTFIQVNQTGVHYNMIFNDEHLATSSISYQKNKKSTLVTWELSGSNHALITAGYEVLFIKYIFSSSLELGLENLKSQTEMNLKNKSDT
ncbi:SRPBCC family protein [Pseudoalteromonas denitrificans]|uniref:Polyketide cyclase / dehydrase and lipid transport n=1 Tax=Pseudoalteromonas denitrificans DSM 6059 TaxID=1123010 RepID=A0A1I1PCK1_9GAMM|nr:SRPBCC family protein [Pseudoalteromonas denitrificans]SFD07577.1 Polyketide cyclase / dehydrase and lipid transport [Pseudoalteromonas denitrificans DSM 6059]